MLPASDVQTLEIILFIFIIFGGGAEPPASWEAAQAAIAKAKADAAEAAERQRAAEQVLAALSEQPKEPPKASTKDADGDERTLGANC